MPDIIVNIAGKGKITFPEGTSDAEIESTIDKEFPRDGADVANDLSTNPDFEKSMSIDDFKKYKDYLATKQTDWAKVFGDAVDYTLNTAGKAIESTFTSNTPFNPAVGVPTAIEAAAEGTRSLYGVIAQSEDPNSILFKFKNLITNTGSEVEQLEQFKQAREFSRRTQELESGKDTLTGISPEYINNDVKNALAMIADPTMLIPVGGEVLGIGKIASKAVGAATKGAGKALGAVSEPIAKVATSALDAGLNAIGADAGAIRSAIAATGTTAAVLGNPVAQGAALAYGGIKAAEKSGSIIAKAGENLMNAPTRIGPLESLGLAPNASAVDRVLARVGRYGGDTAIDLGLRSAVGSVEGSVVGGGLGYLSGGEEGAAAGAGSGFAMGAGGAGITRAAHIVTGKAALEARAADLKRFIDSLDADTKAKFESIVKRDGVNAATMLVDGSNLLKGALGDASVNFLTGKEFAAKHGADARGVQYTGAGDTPSIDINIDHGGSSYTFGHELFHALDSAEQLKPISEKIKQQIVGTYLPDNAGVMKLAMDGMLSEADVVKRFDEYKAKLPASNAEWDNATRIDQKAALVGKELGSEYMAKMLSGSSPDALLRGFDGITRGLLDSALMKDASSRLGRIAESFGIGANPVDSMLFKDLQNASPSLNASLRELVRARKNLDERMVSTEQNGVIITPKEIASSKIVSDKAVKAGLAEIDAAGNVRVKTDDELHKEEQDASSAIVDAVNSTAVSDPSQPHLRIVDGEVIGGGASPEQLAAIKSSPKVSDKLKQAIELVNKSLTSKKGEGNVLGIEYAAALRKILKKLTGKYVNRYSSGIRMMSREIAPYQLYVSKAGNFVMKAIDTSKLRLDAQRMAESGRLGPYQNDIKAFMSDAAQYFEMMSDPSTPAGAYANLVGADKSAFMHGTFGTGEKGGAKYIRDFRLDRITDLIPTNQRIAASELAWQRQKVNWMPPEKLPNGEVTTSDEGYRIVKTASAYDAYSLNGEKIGKYSTQAEAERATQKDWSERYADEIEYVADASQTGPENIQGAIGPDSDVSSLMEGDTPINWGKNLMPTVDDSRYPFLTPEIFAKIQKESGGKISMIMIDRMRVGEYNGITLQGGMMYAVTTDNLGKRVVWAFNSKTVATAVAKRAARTGGYVKLVLMKEGNVIGNKTFTHIWFKEVKEAIAAGRLDEKQVLKKLNEFRERFKYKPRGKKSYYMTDKSGKQTVIKEAGFPEEGFPIKDIGTYTFTDPITKKEVTISFEPSVAKKGERAGEPKANARFLYTETLGLKEPKSQLKKFSGHNKPWKNLEQAFADIESMPQIKRGGSYFQKSTREVKSGKITAYGQLLSKEMTNAGFPDAIKIVENIEEPAFKGIPDGAAVGIIKFDPISENENIQTGTEAGVPEHLSYGYVLKGEPVARMSYFKNTKELYPKKKPMELDQFKFPLKDIGTQESHHGKVNWMPSDLTPRDINDIAKEVGGGDVKGGAKAFGAFMRSMNDKGITLRDVVKSYGITLSSIRRQERAVETIKRNWPDAPFKSGTKIRPEDAFAALLGTEDGQAYLNAAEKGIFDEGSADRMMQKFKSFGFQNKLKQQMKDAVEQFYPKAKEIINAVNSMPTEEFADYVKNNLKGISYGKVGFWSGQLGRGDIPTFDSRQGKLVYGKEVAVNKKVLMSQKDRLSKLGISVPEEYKDFAMTLLHHEVWDRLNKSDTKHEEIKNAMLNYMPADVSKANPSSATTQNAGTRKTYERLSTVIPKDVEHLDYAAGLGIGVDALREKGKSVKSLELFPQRWSSKTQPSGPDYTDPKQIDKKFKSASMLSVLNVIERPLRDEVLKDFASHLDDGGVGYITARTFNDVMSAKTKKVVGENGTAITVKSGNKDVFQKGFRNGELLKYATDILGNEFKIEKNPLFNGESIKITKNLMPATESDAKYLEAVKSGDMATAQKMVDKAAKKSGYTTDKVYHGTNKKFTSFVPSKSGRFGPAVYAAKEENKALGYANSKVKQQGGEPVVMGLYPKKSMQVDSGIARSAYPQDFKSPDAVTYDDAGNIIQLSERFNQENKDIRYMPSTESDAAYMSAVQSGDMATAQKMVDEAAKKAGIKKSKLLKFYYSSKEVEEIIKNAELKVKSIADDYVSNMGEEMSDSEKWDNVGFDNNKLGFETSGGDYYKIKVEWPKGTEELTDSIYQVVEIHNGKTRILDSSLRHTLNEKYASDPVRYDDDGNVIPLSERFNQENKDIRYMPAEVNLQPQQMPNGTLYMAAGGYKIIQQTGGNFRLYSPTGTLVAVNQTLEDSKKKLEKILK